MIVKFRQQLGDLLKHLGLPLIICECGVAEGLFAKQIMDWGTERLYLVDRWEHAETNGDSVEPQLWHDNNLQQVRDRMAIYDNRPEKYIILQGESVEMAEYLPDNILSLIYIDADHFYDGVTADIKAWYSKVRSGGIFAFHDYLSPDFEVGRAVNDWCLENGYSKEEIIIIPETGIMDAGAYFIKH